MQGLLLRETVRSLFATVLICNWRWCRGQVRPLIQIASTNLTSVLMPVSIIIARGRFLHPPTPRTEGKVPPHFFNNRSKGLFIVSCFLTFTSVAGQTMTRRGRLCSPLGACVHVYLENGSFIVRCARRLWLELLMCIGRD